MALPIDLYLVRHGESEGNYAHRLDRCGVGDKVDPAHWKRHTSELRLTNTGIKQAKAAGEWLKANSRGFEYCLCSDFVRAKETAAYLDLPDAAWDIDPYLVERSTGDLEGLRQQERIDLYGEDYVEKMVDHFYTRPPNGESRHEATLRWDRMMLSLSQRHESDRVVIVSHGTLIESGVLRRLHWTVEDFYRWKKANDEETRVHNCQIIHFTRRDPENDRILPAVRHWRTICPWDQKRTKDIWRPIVAKRYSSQELLEQVKTHPRLLED